MKSYKELIEEFIPDHPNRFKLLDALETREVIGSYESDNSGEVDPGFTMDEIWETIFPKVLPKPGKVIITSTPIGIDNTEDLLHSRAKMVADTLKGFGSKAEDIVFPPFYAKPQVPEEECGYCVNIMSNLCRTCDKGEWHYSDVGITNNFKPYPNAEE